MVRGLAIACLVASVSSTFAADLTLEEADARLRRCAALAKETNNQRLLDRVLDLRDSVEQAFKRNDIPAAERYVRDAESVVDVDAGGKSMFGLPLAQQTPRLKKQLDPVETKLAQAMIKFDRPGVEQAVREMQKLLGESAGAPDLRRRGDKIVPKPAKPSEVTDVFLKALLDDQRRLKTVLSGKPLPNAMARFYAAIVDACVTMRPLVRKSHPDKLPQVDAVVDACCRSMLALQLDDGLFKFPDLRGENIRFGEMTEKLVKANPDAVKDGWIVVPDPEGGSQFDAGECGMALLRAGTEYKNAAWTTAGRKAADWAMKAPCVPNFNYNAFSVSLLCQAHRSLGDAKYLESAKTKFALGVLPGQLPSGRWVDPHNARVVYHLILLRAAQDLEESLPAGDERNLVASVAEKAVQSFLDEAEKLGVASTSLTVQVLARQQRLHPAPKVRSALETAATGVMYRCTVGGKVRAGAPLEELAAVAQVWPE